MENKKLSISTIIVLICVFAISFVFLYIEKYCKGNTSGKYTPTPGVEDTPTPGIENTPTPDVEKTPTPGVEDTPTSGVEDTPTPGIENTPTPDVEKTPTPHNEKTPTPHNEKTPTPDNKNTPTPHNEKTPTPDNKNTPIPGDVKRENKNLVSAVYFNGNKLFEDDGGKLYYTITGESEKDFNPEITVSSLYGGLNISFTDGGITKDKIENNVPVKIKISNEQYYLEKEITVTALPIININTSSKITDEDSDIKFYLFGNTDPKLREITSDGTIRFRGGNTKLYPKKGYKLSLTKKKNGQIKNNKISLLGMRSDDDWVLYAAYNDSEKVKNVFCSSFWYDSCADNNGFGIKNGYEYRFTELFINGEYFGLYALGYHMDAKQSGIKEVSGGIFDEFLFKKADWVCELEELLSSDKLTGYELKNGDECQNEEDGFTVLANYYRLIAEAVSEIELNGRDSVKNKEIIEKLYNCCDIGNAVDVYLFYIFVIAEDNTKGGPYYPSEDGAFAGIKNIYIAFKKDGDGYKAVFTPWDLDLTWGNHYSEDCKNFTDKYEHPGYYPMSEMKLSPVYLLLEAGDENIAALLRERLAELLSSSWSEEKLLALACSLENDIFNSGAFLRDRERWPDGNYVEPEQKLTCLKNDISGRCAFISGYLEELINEHK